MKYQWESRPDIGNNWTSSQQSITIQLARTTRIIVTATDSLGCIARDTVEICVREQGSVSAGLDTTICASDAPMIDLRRGEPAWCGRDPIVYEWEPRTDCIIPDASKPWNAILRPRKTTTFILRATDDNGRGTSVADSVVVTIRDSIKLEFESMTLRVCEGDQPSSIGVRVWNGSGPYIHSWQLPTNTTLDSRSDSVSYIPNSALSAFTTSGWLHCQTVDANGCDRRDSIYIDIVPRPVVDLAAADSSCLCDERTVTAIVSGGTPFPDGTYKFSWTENSVDAPSGTISLIDTSTLSVRVRPLYTTTYAIRVVDANGCTSSMSLTLVPPQLGGSIELQAPLVAADPRLEDVPIEIEATSSQAVIGCKPDAVGFSLQYHESLYDPFPSAEHGLLLSSKVVTVGNERYRRVRFRIIPIEPLQATGMLTRIHGKALIGSPAQTSLTLDSIQVFWSCDTVIGVGVDGSLRLDSLCLSPTNTRRVLVFNSVTIAGVRPNPNNGAFTASLRLSNSQPFDVDLVSVQGIRVWSKQIIPSTPLTIQRVDVPIDTDVAPGAYMLTVRNGASVSVQAVLITQ